MTHQVLRAGVRPEDLPKSVTVAMAPSTRSIFMRNRKNRMVAVESPNKPQKILRAEASRNVSQISARVAVICPPPFG
jgi:hypothetical protein